MPDRGTHPGLTARAVERRSRSPQTRSAPIERMRAGGRAAPVRSQLPDPRFIALDPRSSDREGFSPGVASDGMGSRRAQRQNGKRMPDPGKPLFSVRGVKPKVKT